MFFITQDVSSIHAVYCARPGRLDSERGKEGVVLMNIRYKCYNIINYRKVKERRYFKETLDGSRIIIGPAIAN